MAKRPRDHSCQPKRCRQSLHAETQMFGNLKLEKIMTIVVLSQAGLTRKNQPLRAHVKRSGQSLVEAVQASPHRTTKIEPRRAVMPVRAVKL